MKIHVVYNIEEYSNLTRPLDGIWQSNVLEGAVLRRCLCAASLFRRLGEMATFLTGATLSYVSVDCLMGYSILKTSIH